MFTITFEILGEKFRIRNVKATNEFEARKAINDFIKRSVKPTDAEGSVGCKRLLLHLHFKYF
jgi:hypothetical protein